MASQLCATGCMNYSMSGHIQFQVTGKACAHLASWCTGYTVVTQVLNCLLRFAFSVNLCHDSTCTSTASVLNEYPASSEKGGTTLLLSN